MPTSWSSTRRAPGVLGSHGRDGLGPPAEPPGWHLHRLRLERRLPSRQLSATVTDDTGARPSPLKRPGRDRVSDVHPADLRPDRRRGYRPQRPGQPERLPFTVDLGFTRRLSRRTSRLCRDRRFPAVPDVGDSSSRATGRKPAFTTGGYDHSVSAKYAHGQPRAGMAGHPGKASWLKEFFSVQMMVTNLADPTSSSNTAAPPCHCRPACPSHPRPRRKPPPSDAGHPRRAKRHRDLAGARRHRGLLPSPAPTPAASNRSVTPLP